MVRERLVGVESVCAGERAVKGSGRGKVPHALAYFIQPYQVMLVRMRSPSQFAVCARRPSGFRSAGDGAKCQERSHLGIWWRNKELY